jgi:hypothetical protein
MARPHRVAAGGMIYHTLNRAVARRAIFEDAGDFAAFLAALDEAVSREQMRL